MPRKGKKPPKEVASKPWHFKKSLVDPKNMDQFVQSGQQSGLVDHTSFMDSGEAYFHSKKPGQMDEDLDEDLDEEQDVDAREETAQGSRETLLQQMEEENYASIVDAINMYYKHCNHRHNVLLPAIKEAQEKVRLTYLNYIIYETFASKVSSNDANDADQELTKELSGKVLNDEKRKYDDGKKEIDDNKKINRGRIKRTYYRIKRHTSRNSYKDSQTEADQYIGKVQEAINGWDAELKNYHDNVYMKRFKDYDELFQAYYAISRNVQGIEKPFLSKEDKDYDEGVSKDLGKNIAEYLGVYDSTDLAGFAQWVKNGQNAYKLPNVEIINPLETDEEVPDLEEDYSQDDEYESDDEVAAIVESDKKEESEDEVAVEEHGEAEPIKSGYKATAEDLALAKRVLLYELEHDINILAEYVCEEPQKPKKAEGDGSSTTTTTSWFKGLSRDEIIKLVADQVRSNVPLERATLAAKEEAEKIANERAAALFLAKRAAEERAKKPEKEEVVVEKEEEEPEKEEVVVEKKEEEPEEESKPKGPLSAKKLLAPHVRKFITSHTMVALEAFGKDAQSRQITTLGEEQQSGTGSVRVYIDKHMRGYKEGQAVSDVARTSMSGLNLRIDERGANGAFIVSQKSAKIYQAKRSGGKATTSGFFVGGRFIPSKSEVMSKQSEGNVVSPAASSWSDVDKQERLRRAIRRSDFFRHVNAATISYYRNYDGDDNVQDKHVRGDLMAQRDSILSWTTVKQNWQDGTYLSLLGGLSGAVVGGLAGRGIEEKQAEIFELYTELLGDASSNPAIARVISEKLRLKPVVAEVADDVERLSTAGLGFAFAPISLGAAGSIGTLLAGIGVVIHNCMEIYEAIEENSKSEISESDFGILVTKKILGIGEAISAVIDSIVGGFNLGEVPGLSTAITALNDGLRLLIDVVGGGLDIYDYAQMKDLEKTMETALSALHDDNAEQGAKDLGQAVSDSAQAQMFAAEGRRRARNGAIGKTVDVAANGLDLAGTLKGSTTITGAALRGGAKIISFLGLGLDRLINFGSLKNDIELILGDRDLLGVPGFNTVLKEETGINNKHYLRDLSKVFAAIDTHVLMKNATSSGESDLVAEISKRVLDANEQVTAKTFNKLIQYVGAPKNWRSVLLESIS